eukprot:2990128-Amphidinium_carterae.1
MLAEHLQWCKTFPYAALLPRLFSYITCTSATQPARLLRIVASVQHSVETPYSTFSLTMLTEYFLFLQRALSIAVARPPLCEASAGKANKPVEERPSSSARALTWAIAAVLALTAIVPMPNVLHYHPTASHYSINSPNR